MSQKTIPVPAESLRTMTESAAKEVRQARADGREYTAERIQNAISEALDATEGKEGQFVSVRVRTASVLTAFGHSTDPEVSRHSEAMSHYLEQYNYW